MIYNKEMKRLGDSIFDKKFSYKKKMNYVEFQTVLTMYRSTTPICLFTVLKCQYRDMDNYSQIKRPRNMKFGYNGFQYDSNK